MGTATQLRCSRCEKTYSPAELLNLCSCGSPLLVDYDLAAIRDTWSKEMAAAGPSSLWRYAPVLPAGVEDAVTLQEGWTPLLHVKALGRELGFAELLLKDEARNPTDSFKARGLCLAVTMAKKLGAKELAIPSAGNAAGALAAYAARAGLKAHIFMPSDVPESNFLECKAFGAEVTLVDGLISDCARIVNERKQRQGWFEVSTLKEPYRIEGKKTMGYELAEQLDWQLPDVVLYPCGGGVGLIGMWKAFSEMEQLGWIGSKRPRMVAVQAKGCEPITRAYQQGLAQSQFYDNAHTVASGLRVPKALGDFLILRAIEESQGSAISVSDEAMIDSALQLAELEGIFAAPETGACVAALQELSASGFLKQHETVVIFSTGAGLKYAEAFSTRFLRRGSGEQDKLGGLITPR